ncbi:MAG: DUF2934 domain-containing protein [Kiritimatiellaceae bacterium]|nr:DUF2934 domain-containing protein [Kiritimatiellaceae bacterium]
MATEKKTVKKTATKPAVKKAVAAKPAVKKAIVKKAPAKKAVAKKETIPQERFYAMVSEAAYFASQNDGNKKSSTEYWMDAEAAVRAKFNVA